MLFLYKYISELKQKEEKIKMINNIIAMKWKTQRKKRQNSHGHNKVKLYDDWYNKKKKKRIY